MKYITLIIAAVLLVIYLCTYSMSEREYVVLTRFGKPIKSAQKSGLHKKLPGFFESVNRIDKRTHIFNTKPIQLLLGDKNPIVITCYICWRVKDPLLFFQSLLNDDVATQKLSDMVNSQMGNALGEFKLSNIINTDPSQIKLSDLEDRILSNTNSSSASNYGIEVVQIGIKRIAYPSVVADAVYSRMRSEREKEAKKFRAEGREEATKIRVKADREATEILAEAFKKSEILKGEGDQKALKIYSHAYQKDKTFFEFIKSMENI